MKTLFINATVLETSRTLNLTRHLLKYYRDIHEVDLKKDIVPPIDNETFNVKYGALEKGNFSHPSLKNAMLLKEAETLIIAAPIWNVGFPASLKAFLDDAIITNLTFKYGPNGTIISLCNVKKVILVSTAGGKLIEEHTINFVKDFSKMFLACEDVTLYKAEFLDVFKDKVEEILNETKSIIDNDYNK